MNLSDSISYLKGVGQKRAALLNKAGICTIRDLLTYFPRTYLDWSAYYSISGAPLNENVCIRAFVGSPCRVHPIRKGMTTYSVDVTDGQSVLSVVFFNNKYVCDSLKQGEEYLFYGKITKLGNYYKSMTSPKFIPVSGSDSSLRPVYSQCGGFQTYAIEKLIKSALDSCKIDEECIPESIRNDYCLMSYADAIYNMHFPENPDMLAEAKRRISFEELFLLQLGLSRLKIKSKTETSVRISRDYTDEFISSLSFELTGAQNKAVKECVSDMSSGFPMNRLLQGDVGSGKTAVAASIIYNCIKNGYQAVMMAPTEVLAQQHYKTFSSFFDGCDISVDILTGSVSAAKKKAIKSELAEGKLQLVIGTHAVIQKDVEFKNLGLAVTDEQHRFGVNQRGMLSAKGDNPHVLVMSATPIPRTLSLIIYGDLDISILDEMPVGRQKTDTFLIDTSVRERAYGYVKKHILEGYQGYIVCPLVDYEEDENDDNEKIASVKLYKQLSDGFFKGFRLGLLYGKMNPAEKKSVMKEFADGNLDLLISTTVIEVGVDVPNAVIMVIENAESFGLSQLHQLRGRVGRGSVKSTCILISDNEASDRLKIMTATTDGFKIADEDLRLRGPGDFFGSRQHGLPDLKAADMLSDGEVVRETHIAAEKLLKKNPTLSGEEYDLLKKNVNIMFSKGLVLN